MFTTTLAFSLHPTPSNPVTFPEPLNLHLNLIYAMGSLLRHGLWSYIMFSYPVTKRGQTAGTASDQCSTSFFSWYIFLWGARLQLEIVCAWAIFRCPLTHLMHPVLQCQDLAEKNNTVIHFVMEIPSRSLQVNILGREWWRCGSLKGVWENKHILLLYRYGTMGFYNWSCCRGCALMSLDGQLLTLTVCCNSLQVVVGGPIIMYFAPRQYHFQYVLTKVNW